jgi:REP element-mobilizing transposase RayT
MPRKSRIDAPGAVHHIICRGIDRQAIFADDHDRDNYIERLGKILITTQTLCMAWALLPNHFHLLLKTGGEPVATVMRRLLTGYAVSHNRRHNRSGHLFQNRYKSILCQEDTYLLELVRYIHLNPLRAGIVTSLDELDDYRYCGHSRLMGRFRDHWQATDEVLSLFGERQGACRRRYREFVEKAIGEGTRPELTGGGMVRSVGGWKKIKSLRQSGWHLKSDERILGDSDFVEAVLEHQQEKMDRRYRLKAAGYDLDKLIERVCERFDLAPEDILEPGKQPKQVQAKSLVCYLAVRKLGLKGTEVGQRLRLTQSAVSRAVQRGKRIATELDFSL